MWKLLGFSDEKDPDAATAPQQLTMVRSRAVRGQSDGEAEAVGAPSMSKSGGSAGGRFTTCEFKTHGIRLDYPKNWSVVEEQRKIILYHPSDRSISINLIIGVVAFGTDLDELTSQALDMYPPPLSLSLDVWLSSFIWAVCRGGCSLTCPT
jgi:hypothetical protein